MLVPLLLVCLRTLDPSPAAGLTYPVGDTLQPPRRAHHSFVYDEAGQRVLLTRGSTPLDGGNRFDMFNDRWAFDGARWTPLGPSGGKWSGSALAYDTRGRRILAYGGYDGASLRALRVLEGDTWRTLPPHPELAAAEPGFVYDNRRGRFVAFGGSSGPGQPNGATWEFGATWSRVTTASLAARQAHAMVFDEARGKTFLFGGMGQGARVPRRPPWETPGTESSSSAASMSADSRERPGPGMAPPGTSWPTPAPTPAPWDIWPTTNSATASCSSAAAKAGPTETSTTPGSSTAPPGAKSETDQARTASPRPSPGRWNLAHASSYGYPIEQTLPRRFPEVLHLRHTRA